MTRAAILALLITAPQPVIVAPGISSGGNVESAIVSKVASGSDAIVLQQGATIQCSEAGGLDDTEIWASGASTLNVSASGGTVVLSGAHTCTSTSCILANLSVQGTIASTRTTDLSWTIQSAANQACNTTCVSACVFGWNTAAGEVAVGCTDATADKCLCAGGS